MSDGGKGSKPRPFSVSQEEYDKRWDAIFQRDLPKEEDKLVLPMPGTMGGAKVVFKDDYQDVLSTEDCVVDALDEYKKQAQELWNDSCTSVRKMRD
jgi:hypothetical protein